MNTRKIKKRFNIIKRNLRNRMRSGMRKVVNFALADEPNISLEEEALGSEPEETETSESQPSVKPDKKFNIVKILKIAGAILGIIFIFKLGKKSGMKRSVVISNDNLANEFVNRYIFGRFV